MALLGRWRGPAELELAVAGTETELDAAAAVVVGFPRDTEPPVGASPPPLLQALLRSTVSSGHSSPGPLIGLAPGTWEHPWAPWSARPQRFEVSVAVGSSTHRVQAIEVAGDHVTADGPAGPSGPDPVVSVHAEPALLLEWLAGGFCLGNVLALGGSVVGSLWHLSLLDAVVLWRRTQQPSLPADQREAIARVLADAHISELTDRIEVHRLLPGVVFGWYDDR